MAKSTLRFVVSVFSLIIGLILITAGFLGLFFIPIALRAGIEKQLVIDGPDAEMFSTWVTNGGDNPPMWDYFYVFNITNLNDVLNGEMPRYEELGPYVYRHVQTKLDPEWSDDQSSVSFFLHEYWLWNETLSARNRTDIITNINPAYLGVMMQVGNEVALTVTMAFPQIKEIIENLETHFAVRVETQVFPEVIQTAFSRCLSAPSIKGDLELFYRAFFNRTFAPATDPGDIWEGVLVSELGNDPSGITVESADLLFSVKPFAFFDVANTSTVIWYDALRQNSTANSFLQSEFKLSENQLAILLRWYEDSFVPKRIHPYLASAFSLSVGPTWYSNGLRADLAFQQFATASISQSIFGADTVTQIMPQEVFGGPTPEYGCWLERNFHHLLEEASFDKFQMGDLLNGTSGLFDVNNVLIMLGHSDNASFELSHFNISQQQEEIFFVFVAQHLVPQFVSKTFLPNLFAQGGGLFTNRTVEEIVLSAVDPLVVKLAGPPAAICSLNRNATDENWTRQKKLRDAWDTGKFNISNIGNFSIFNGSAVTTPWQWPSPHEVSGTFGDAFAPGERDIVRAFVTDMALTIDLQKSGQETVYGILLNDYSLPLEQFNINPKYDIDTVRGFINLTRQQASPMYVSKPHFLDSLDDWISGHLENFSFPQRDLHDTVIGVEPWTGVVMHAHKRLQFSLYVPPKKQANWFNLFNSKILRGQFYPLAWLDQQGMVTEELADTFRNQVYGTQNLGVLMQFLGFSAGGFLITLGAILLTFELRARRKGRSTVELSLPGGDGDAADEESPLLTPSAPPEEQKGFRYSEN